MQSAIAFRGVPREPMYSGLSSAAPFATKTSRRDSAPTATAWNDRQGDGEAAKGCGGDQRRNRGHQRRLRVPA